MAESQKAEQGHLFGVPEFSSPTEVRLPQLHAPGTVSSEAEFVFPKGTRARTHTLCVHLYAWPATQTSTD